MAAKPVHLTPVEIARHAAVLSTSLDREEVAWSALSLASSAQPEALAPLGRLCEMLAASPGFLAEPDRKVFLLPALAAVRPPKSSRRWWRRCSTTRATSGSAWREIRRFRPPWATAETPVLKTYLKLGEHIERTRKPPEPLARAVERTLLLKARNLGTP